MTVGADIGWLLLRDLCPRTSDGSRIFFDMWQTRLRVDGEPGGRDGEVQRTWRCLCMAHGTPGISFCTEIGWDSSARRKTIGPVILGNRRGCERQQYGTNGYRFCAELGEGATPRMGNEHAGWPSHRATRFCALGSRSLLLEGGGHHVHCATCSLASLFSGAVNRTFLWLAPGSDAWQAFLLGRAYGREMLSDTSAVWDRYLGTSVIVCTRGRDTALQFTATPWYSD